MERAEKSRKKQRLKKKNKRGRKGGVIHVEEETDTKKEGTPRKQKSCRQLLLCLVSELFAGAVPRSFQDLSAPTMNGTQDPAVKLLHLNPRITRECPESSFLNPGSVDAPGCASCLCRHPPASLSLSKTGFLCQQMQRLVSTLPQN